MAEQPTNIIVESGGDNKSKKVIPLVFNFLTHQKLGRFLLASLIAFNAYIFFQRFIKFEWPFSVLLTSIIFILIILGVSFGSGSVILILSIIGLPLLFIVLGDTIPDAFPAIKLNPFMMVSIVLFWLIFIFVALQNVYQNKKSILPLILVFSNIALYFLLMWPASSQIIFTGFQVDAPIRTAVESQQAEWGKISENIASSISKAKMEAQRQVNFAKGDYEAGIEAQSQQPLGIFLESTGTNSPIRQTEDLKIFGYIKAETKNPEDKFKIGAKCYGIFSKDDTKKWHEATFNPPGDELSSGDYKSFDCSIPSIELSATTANTQAVLETTFDFATSAYVRTYFMKQDVIRSYRMQNLDPLGEFNIQDKNPVAVYTGGPLMIGMKAGLLQPVPLVDNVNVGPSLDITFDKTAKWPEGELIKINSIILTAPPGLEIVGAGVSCGHDGDPQKCKIDVDEFIEFEENKPLNLPRSIRFETKIKDIQKILGNSALGVHSFKIDAEYTFRIKKSFDVRVIGVGGLV